jgi:hypothetical protein
MGNSHTELLFRNENGGMIRKEDTKPKTEHLILTDIYITQYHPDILVDEGDCLR